VRSGQGRSVEAAGRRIALFNLENQIVALDDRCPGDGRPLSEGRQIEDGRLVECEGDGCQVDLTNGLCQTTGTGVPTYPVRVGEKDGRIEVRL
jgi:nitrite reductase/ring-hydroxylating ferredoxin subunit